MPKFEWRRTKEAFARHIHMKISILSFRAKSRDLLLSLGNNDIHFGQHGRRQSYASRGIQTDWRRHGRLATADSHIAHGSGSSIIRYADKSDSFFGR